jgi:hypothetical protein
VVILRIAVNCESSCSWHKLIVACGSAERDGQRPPLSMTSGTELTVDRPNSIHEGLHWGAANDVCRYAEGDWKIHIRSTRSKDIHGAATAASAFMYSHNHVSNGM